MAERQTRYRNRKNEQGFIRVEVLVPKPLESYVKSYARALRDAHLLGANPPLFEGMVRPHLSPSSAAVSPDKRVTNRSVKLEPKNDSSVIADDLSAKKESSYPIKSFFEE